MKNNRSILILAIAIVLIIGAAYFFYNRLAGDFGLNFIVVQDSDSQKESISTEDSSLSQDNSSVEQDIEEATETHDEMPSQEDEQTLQPAPDFTFYDFSGNAINLSDYQGQPIILNFWASWCGPCKMEMPGFENLYQEYGEEIQFLMINLTDGSSETVDSANDFIQGEGYTFPVFYDTDQSGAMTYGIRSIPTTYFINSEGNLVAYAMGAVSEEALREGIESFFNI